MTKTGRKIVPNLWFVRQAEEAAGFYASVFANAKVGPVIRAGKVGFETHGLPEGAVMTVEFEIEGQTFVGINGGPMFKFTPAVSFLVACRTKEDVDALWDKLAEGGTALMELGEYPFSERYGWTQDKYGLSWQVVPAALSDLMSGPDPARSQRVMAALMQMVKLDIGQLKQAYEQS